MTLLISLLSTDSLMWYCFGSTAVPHERFTVDLKDRTLDGARAGTCPDCGVTYVNTKPK